MTFDAAEQVADAVLYEGYVLYPYRASAAKNQFRWQFGVVAPRAPRDCGEPWFAQTECLVEPADSLPRLSMRVRFLRPRTCPERTESACRRAAGDGGSTHPWLEGVPQALEGVPHAIDVDAGPLDHERPREWPLSGIDIDARVILQAESAGRFIKLQIRLENLERWSVAFGRIRDIMLCRSLVAAHVLLRVDGGAFISLLDPPPDAAALAESCQNRHTWPVLVGDHGRRDLMLSSPIVLYDFPAVAHESQGDLCDAAEIDEIISLRIMTMTDEEKAEARATDPRARAILDRIERLTPDQLGALHETLRRAEFFHPPGTASPDQAFITIDGVRVAKGSRVWLRPNRRAEAMDMFLRDQAATVAAIHRDVDDRVHIAVTVDADPAASLPESFRRFFYFDPAEIEPIVRPRSITS
jgi:hypothetical protein